MQVAYAIGVAKPVSIMVDTFGTGTVSDEKIEQAVEKAVSYTHLPKGRCTNCCAAALFDAKPCKQSAAGYIIQIDTV